MQIHIMNNIEIRKIINEYYPQSLQHLGERFVGDLTLLVQARHEELKDIGTPYGISLNDVLSKVYKSTAKFPFFINKLEIKKIISNTFDLKIL